MVEVYRLDRACFGLTGAAGYVNSDVLRAALKVSPPKVPTIPNIAFVEPGSPLMNPRSQASTASRAAAVLFVSCLALFTAVPALPGPASPAAPRLDAIQAVVDGLRGRLAIRETVQVAVVPANKLLLSVETENGRGGPYHVSIDAGFLEELTTDELDAALAHELGHVWIATHHPFLQTERLANEIALRVVERTQLELVYRKMWARLGRTGKVDDLLGEPMEAAPPTKKAD
jgi:hypothetical protein